jgi:hypothetical protein
LDSWEASRRNALGGEAERALLTLLRDASSIANQVPALIEKLAGVDGRVTPKERERLAQAAAWLDSGLRNIA